MYLKFFFILGIVTVLISVIHFINIKFVKKSWYNLLFPLIVIVILAIQFPKEFFSTSMIGILLIFALVCFITRDRYEITNVNKKMVMSALTSVLDDKNISYDTIEGFLMLSEYGSKQISYKQTLSVVAVDFKGIKSLPFYESVKKDFISSIKQIKTAVFPSTGIFYLSVGVFLILLSLILEN